MCEMKDLKIKLYYLSDFLFTVKVNGEEREVNNKTNTITFRLPEDADYEIEIVQKQSPGNFKLWHILLAPFLLVLFIILIFVLEDLPHEWIGDIQPFLLKTKFKGNMRRHSELNFYYYASRNIKDDYTKPQLVCDEIASYETTYEVNRKSIKKTFHRFVAVMTASMLIPMVIFVPILIFGLISSPIEIVDVIVSSVLILATIAVYAIVIILRRRKWYKYLRTK